ncbi:MAG: hypothetical protein N3C63_03315 [Rhodocyclaceae bacterium]|nr:hypothetical protein [Rhodocyclaceae bacterium]
MADAQAAILLVGANARNLDLLEEFFARRQRHCIKADSLARLDAQLAAGSHFALALVDISGFDAAIWPRCQKLHDAQTPLLVISPRQSADLRREGLAHGAHDVLVKPLMMRDLAALTETMLAE